MTDETALPDVAGADDPNLPPRPAGTMDDPNAPADVPEPAHESLLTTVEHFFEDVVETVETAFDDTPMEFTDDMYVDSAGPGATVDTVPVDQGEHRRANSTE